MKMTIEVDCSPEEARRFLGLPDVTELNEAMVAELRAKMAENIATMTPDEMMKTWLPGGMQGLEQMQKAFWAGLSGQGGAGPKDK